MVINIRTFYMKHNGILIIRRENLNNKSLIQRQRGGAVTADEYS